MRAQANTERGHRQSSRLDNNLERRHFAHFTSSLPKPQHAGHHIRPSSTFYLPRIATLITTAAHFNSNSREAKFNATQTPTSLLANMSAEEDLIDYSDEELQTTDAAPAAANGDAKKDAAATGATDAQGSYAGVHSTSFRDFLLKPELLKAITDCGFEHPSMS
jgi:hypothetical protein